MRTRGVALSELLVAVAVLIPVAVVTVGLFPYAHMVDRRAWALSQAENAARSRLEALRAMDFEDLPAVEASQETRDGFDYRVEVTTSPESDLVRRASVVVRWNTGREEEYRLDSLLIRTAPEGGTG